MADPKATETNKEDNRRQYVNFTYYKIDPAWRRLPEAERKHGKRQFIDVVKSYEPEMLVIPYSMVGIRGDCDFMLWRISYDLLKFQEMSAQLFATDLGKYLTVPYSYLAMTKRSTYVREHQHADQEGVRLRLTPGKFRYLFVYPFVKTRAWYNLSPHARQGMMDEHINAATPFKGVRINTSYRYGIDDQEFVVSFDSDHPQEFVDLVGRLRYTEASLYTLRDTPMFTCAKAEPEALLAQLG